MRFLIPVLTMAALAACSPPVPDSGAGVGFENYDRYLAERRAREAQLARGPAPVRQTVQPPVQSPAQSPVQSPVQTPAQTTAQFPGQTPAQPALRTGQIAAPGVATGFEPNPQAAAPRSAAEQTAAEAVAAIRPEPPIVTAQTAPVRAPAAAPDPNNVEISDEQDFNAVSSRQSIESDAQRRARQSAQYEVVQPTAVPRRPAGSTPTPIQFALEVRHPVGQKVYTRSPFGAAKQAENCARYGSSELAQDAFLKAGGPKRDKLKLDFDGDGYACNWDPSKYRQLVRG